MSWSTAQIKDALKRIEAKLDKLLEEKTPLTMEERMAKARAAKQEKAAQE